MHLTSSLSTVRGVPPTPRAGEYREQVEVFAPSPQNPSLILGWIFLQAEAARPAQPGHGPAAGAAPQQAEPASAGETEPVGRGGTPEIPGTVHGTSPTREHTGVHMVFSLSLFKKFIFNGRIIVLQYCFGFCHKSA